MIYLALRTGSSRSPERAERIPVLLTIDDPGDGWAQRQSVTALRQHKLERLAREAYSQGALLTQEELARLVCASRATVKRDIATLRVAGVHIPTISQMDDLGKGLSLKTKIVREWLSGDSFEQLQVNHGRSLPYIKRCCRDFERTVLLVDSGQGEEEICQKLSLSLRLVREYLALFRASGDNERVRMILSVRE